MEDIELNANCKERRELKEERFKWSGKLLEETSRELLFPEAPLVEILL